MKLRLVLNALAALLFAAATSAQCPDQVAETVPASVTFHGQQNCGSVNFNIAGMAYSTANKGCPVLARYVPEHEQIKHTPGSKTKVVEAGPSARVVLFFFRCQSDYFLFISLNTYCVLDRTTGGEQLRRLATASC